MECEIIDANLLKFSFTNIPDIKVPQLQFSISQFKNPFSAKPASDFFVQAYKDADCGTLSGRSKKIASVNFREVLIPATETKISTVSKEVSYIGDDNVYTFETEVQRPLDPRNEGHITITTPYWHVRKYPPLDKSNTCTSTCFDTIERSFEVDDNRAEIFYENMRPECTAGNEKIIITCDNGLNPLYPDTFDGFSITFYDADDVIIQLTNTMRLEASQYTPKQLEQDALVLPESEFRVNQQTEGDEGIFNIRTHQYITYGCFIYIYVPDDIGLSALQSIVGE